MTYAAAIEAQTEPRSYEIFHKRDLRPGICLHWHLRLFGEGDWCRADGHTHKFTTREAAEAAGRQWVIEGRLQ